MNNNDFLPVGCRTCGRVLTTTTDDTGTHHRHDPADPDDHEAVPVVPEPVHGRCAFCSAEDPTHVLPAKEFALPSAPDLINAADWAACDGCAALLRNEHWDWLLDRVVARFHAVYGYSMPNSVHAHLAELYRALPLAVTGALCPLDNPGDARSTVPPTWENSDD